MRKHFRAWLRHKYVDDHALRDAWADGSAGFESALMPSAQEQTQTRAGLFRDPRDERKVIDYYECLAELCGDLVICFNRTVKEATQGTVQAGAFFGYLLELAWNCAFFGDKNESEQSAIQRSGHLGLRRVLESPYVDFISSPFAYGFRGIGGYSPAMMPTESLRLHGKLYYLEDDIRTYLCPQDAGFGVVDTYERSIATLRRSLRPLHPERPAGGQAPAPQAVHLFERLPPGPQAARAVGARAAP